MGMENYTKHQQGIIKRFYENIDQITLSKLSELVTELYLASGKKRDKMWETATRHMEKLGVPKERHRSHSGEAGRGAAGRVSEGIDGEVKHGPDSVRPFAT